MKILNLYCGIGGNRKLWGDEHHVTAVEYNESIANAYKKFFPKDKVIVGDAHEFLLKHFQEFDFIWSSPPCPSHSRMRKTNSGNGERKSPHTFPDMKLYEEIIFLEHFFKGKWVVENVVPYYEYLIKPTIILNRHSIWANFNIEEIKIDSDFSILKSKRGIFNLDRIKLTKRKDQIHRNCVEPKMGKHILDCATKRGVSELKLSKADEHNISLKESSHEDSQISSNDETSLNNNIKGGCSKAIQ